MDLKRKWKEVKGYEGRYIISNYGEVISLPRYKNNKSKLQYVEPKEILQYVNKNNGYIYVMLCKNGKQKNIRLHRLVAEAFIPNSENLLQINHIDGNKQNNKVNNLEWCNQSQNEIHAYKLGLIKNRNKIKVRQYDLDDNFIKEFESMKEASKETGVSISNISQCINNKKKQGYSCGYIWKKGEN